ncbi:transposase [Pseudoalteromonas sp. ZZD1]|uniref:transposase n=1 Tax=Pseudoalteromonas sp. ZZD1 TaxID=3139395 RepID=UPI003BAC8821
MRQYLQLISDATPCGEHAVVIVDHASWHMGNVAQDIKNVSVIPLPPYSPELNPIEQVWAWMRNRVLSNLTFASYDDIVEQVSRAWNVLCSDIDNVKRICSRTWIDMINVIPMLLL